MTRLDAVFPFLPFFPFHFVLRLPTSTPSLTCGAMTHPPGFSQVSLVMRVFTYQSFKVRQSKKKKMEPSLPLPPPQLRTLLSPLLPLSEPAKIAGCPDSKRSTSSPKSRRRANAMASIRALALLGARFRIPGVRSCTAIEESAPGDHILACLNNGRRCSSWRSRLLS
jgi:hypothetical protein